MRLNITDRICLVGNRPGFPIDFKPTIDAPTRSGFLAELARAADGHRLRLRIVDTAGELFDQAAGDWHETLKTAVIFGR